MPFPWSKKVVRIQPISSVAEVVQSASIPVAPPPSPEPEIVQTVEIPSVDDKISVIEHKNGEQVVDARQEDDEDDEVQGDVQEGGRLEEGDYGSEEELEEARGS